MKTDSGTTKIDLSRYAGDPEDSRIQTDAETAKASRVRMFGVIPMDALKTMDKRRFMVLADATVDEVIDAFGHLFGSLQLCDTCEEPATRTATFAVEDRLDRATEYACDCCKFSRRPKTVAQHPNAEVIHRVKAIIAKLQDRR